MNYEINKQYNAIDVIFVRFFPRLRFSPGDSVLLVPKFNVSFQIGYDLYIVSFTNIVCTEFHEFCYFSKRRTCLVMCTEIQIYLSTVDDTRCYYKCQVKILIATGAIAQYKSYAYRTMTSSGSVHARMSARPP